MSRIPFFASRLLPFGAVLLLAASCAREAEQPPVLTGRLQVTTDPSKATVLIDRKARGATPLSMPNLPVGTHLVTLQKEGFATVWQSVELTEMEPRTIDCKLEPVTGLLLLQSTPTNTDVIVNGVLLGHTPMLISTLPPGTHRIKFATPGFQPQEVEVQLPMDRAPVRKQVDLRSNSAALEVITDADGVSIRINGVDYGGSPCKRDRIPEGDVTVELRADGYRPLVHKMKLAAGENQTITLPMEPIPAALKIFCAPAEIHARVYLNNEFKEKTPLELNDLKPGKYRVRVELEGYEPEARDVELKRGDSKPEEFRLSSNTGKIELITEPDHVLVYIDGKAVGETKSSAIAKISEPLTLGPFSAGEHELRLTRKGYAENKQKLQIEAGKTLSLNPRLTRRYVQDIMVVTIGDNQIKGMLESDTEEGIRLERSPGVSTMILRKDIKYQRAIKEDGTLE